MNVLWVGANPGKIGGQSRVAQQSLTGLIALGYHVAAAGKGTQVLDEGEKSICPCYPYSEFDPIENLHRIIDEFKPDVLLLSHDTWNFYGIVGLKAKYPGLKIVGWFTIDAHPIHSSWLAILRACDHVITPTEFGKKTMYEKSPEKSVEKVQYGVDRSVYNLNDPTKIS